ncbi:MAG: YceD family protein [Lysobacteraceae bacterium]
MSNALPERIDAWRTVASRRIHAGTLPLSAMPRLVGLLADAQGECSFELAFERDPFGVAGVSLKVKTRLPLVCQRTLARFELPVEVDQRLGLVSDERDEAALPPEYEAVLVPEDGMLDPSSLIEDELILAVPVVPIDPALPEEGAVWSSQEPREAEENPEPKPNPFAALARLKQTS